MLALRFIGSVFLLAAVMALVSEITRAQLGIAGAPFTPLLQQVTELAPATLNALQRGIQGATHPLVWDLLIKPLLRLPAWGLFGAIGLALIWLGRRRRQRLDVYSN